MSATTGSLPVETLYNENHGWLQSWLNRRLGCPALAADLAQDTFVRLLANPRPLNNLGAARSYLRTVASLAGRGRGPSGSAGHFAGRARDHCGDFLRN